MMRVSKKAAAVIVLFAVASLCIAGCTSPTAAPTTQSFLERWANQYKTDALNGNKSGMNDHIVAINNDQYDKRAQQIFISDSWSNDNGVMQGLGVEIQKYANATAATNDYKLLTNRSPNDGASYGIWWGLNEYVSLAGHQPTVKQMYVTHSKGSNQYGSLVYLQYDNYLIVVSQQNAAYNMPNSNGNSKG
jgi:hypothetical protein